MIRYDFRSSRLGWTLVSSNRAWLACSLSSSGQSWSTQSIPFLQVKQGILNMYKYNIYVQYTNTYACHKYWYNQIYKFSAKLKSSETWLVS